MPSAMSPIIGAMAFWSGHVRMGFWALALSVAAVALFFTLTSPPAHRPTTTTPAEPKAPASMPLATAPQPAPAQPTIEPPAMVRNVTPPKATAVPVPQGPLVRLPPKNAPQLQAPPPPPKPDILRPVIVIDAGSIAHHSERLHFAGINALPLDSQCLRADGSAWSCGRRAATALRMLIRNRAVTCAAAEDRAARRCLLGKIDIGQWLVEQGWAKPAADAPDAYRKAGEEARRQARGQFGEPPRLN